MTCFCVEHAVLRTAETTIESRPHRRRARDPDCSGPFGAEAHVKLALRLSNLGLLALVVEQDPKALVLFPNLVHFKKC